MARALDDPRLRDQVRATSAAAARAVLSRPAALAGVADCCICHGAAFLHYFGLRCTLVDPRESGAFASRWNCYIGDRRRDGELLYRAPDGMKRDASFLGGDSGVICALTRSIHGQPAAWERLMLVA